MERAGKVRKAKKVDLTGLTLFIRFLKVQIRVCARGNGVPVLGSWRQQGFGCDRGPKGGVLWLGG